MAGTRVYRAMGSHCVAREVLAARLNGLEFAGRAGGPRPVTAAVAPRGAVRAAAGTGGLGAEPAVASGSAGGGRRARAGAQRPGEPRALRRDRARPGGDRPGLADCALAPALAFAAEALGSTGGAELPEAHPRVAPWWAWFRATPHGSAYVSEAREDFATCRRRRTAFSMNT
jgi:glutathione S-transferase